MKTKALLVLVAGLMALAVSAQEFKCEDNFKALAASVKAQDYAAPTKPEQQVVVSTPPASAVIPSNKPDDGESFFVRRGPPFGGHISSHLLMCFFYFIIGTRHECTHVLIHWEYLNPRPFL